MPKKMRLFTWEELLEIDAKYVFSAGNPGPWASSPRRSQKVALQDYEFSQTSFRSCCYLK